MKKWIKTLLVASGIFVLTFVLFIGYAVRPVIDDSTPGAGLRTFGVLTYAGEQTGRRRLMPGEHLRMATYNIGYASGEKNNLPIRLEKSDVERNLQKMAEALKGINPDIIALQEVDFNSRRTFYLNQLDYLAQALHMPYAAYVLTWNKRYVAWPYWPLSAHFGPIVSGQAILSRFPILEQNLTVFAKPERNPFWYNWFYLDRVLQELHIDLGLGEPAALWHVHLDAFSPDTRFAQARIVAGQASQSLSPTRFIVGDFNSVSQVKSDLSVVEKRTLEDSGEALREILSSSGFQNAEEPSLPILTMPSWNPIKKIDHILYKGNLRLIGTGSAPGLIASDHLPVWADFVINDSQ